MKRSFDAGSIVGILILAGLLCFGMVSQPDAKNQTIQFIRENFANFYQPWSLLMVIAGTMGAMLFMFPLSQLSKIPKHIRVMFKPVRYIPSAYTKKLTSYAEKARTKGLLALDEDINTIEDSFLQKSVQLLIDSADSKKVNAQMQIWLDTLEERHLKVWLMYEKAASISFAAGCIASLMNLITYLKTAENYSAIIGSLSTILTALFYGALFSCVIFSPFSQKLRVRHEEEYLCMKIICTGIQAIADGENPKTVELRMQNLLSAEQQEIVHKKQTKNMKPKRKSQFKS